jgi:integrase
MDHPGTKNRKEHLVPLSELAVQILAGLPIIDERYVFSTRPGTRASGFSKAKRLADQLSGVADWRLHDLRRTATTGMAELKVDRRVISKLLNHTSRGVIGVTTIYDRYEYLDERAAAMELWAERPPRDREPAAGEYRAFACRRGELGAAGDAPPAGARRARAAGRRVRARGGPGGA